MAETEARHARAVDVEVQGATEALQTVQSVLDVALPQSPTLALREDGEAVANRAIAIARGMRLAAILGLTQPEDWILSKDRAGAETAFIASSGVAKLKAPYGLYRHALPGRTLEPQRVTAPADGETPERKGWSLRFLGGSAFLNLEDEMEATRWDHEKFLGREESPSDPKKAVETLSWSLIARKLIGLSGVPAAELKECGLDLSRCRKGSGYGSAGERGAKQAQDPEVAKAAQEVWQSVLQRTAGDIAKAEELLYDVTVAKAGQYAGKFGARRPEQITTKLDNFKYIWDRLKKHPEYGDQAGGGA